VASWSGRCTVTVQDEAASRLIQMQHTSTCSRAGEQGFSLIEAIVAITLLSVTLVSLVHLFVAATRATMTSRQVTRAVILAEQKMEQLHAVAWATESDGSPVSDFTSNLAAFTATGACAGAATGAAVGLTPSPAGALEGNIDGYVDYVDAQGCGLGGGVVPPLGSVYVRRWSIAPSDAGPDTLLLRVLVTDRGLRQITTGGAADGLQPGEAMLAGLKTRRSP
jgi:type II secretory pathway pseudopilin PulG